MDMGSSTLVGLIYVVLRDGRMPGQDLINTFVIKAAEAITLHLLHESWLEGPDWIEHGGS
jgi:hypothetical protein